jgi:hypothetical protein
VILAYFINTIMAILSFYWDCVHFVEGHLLSCPSKKYLHIECPGCGLQRSLMSLLEGRFMDSFRLYPATVPLISMLVFTFLHLKFKFIYGAMILKYLQFSVAIMILVFYIYKIVNNKIIA